MQVCFHVLKTEIDVSIIGSSKTKHFTKLFGNEIGALPVNTVQSDDVGMFFEGLQEHDLPESALGVGLVPEGVEYLFHSHNFLRLPVYRLPDDPVCALPEPLLDVEALHDVLVDLRHLIFRLCHFDASQMYKCVYNGIDIFIKSIQNDK